MFQGFLPLLALVLGPILVVVPIGLIIGARWTWQTAKAKGRTSRGFFGYCLSGEGRGFSPLEDTFEGLLARSNPWCLVTPIIISLNLLIFAAMTLSEGSLRPLVDPEAEHLVLWGANWGPFTVRGEWWRLLSSVFLHAGFAHLFFNMLFLWVLGNYAERIFGNRTFAILYAFSGIGGNLASLLWRPAQVTLGASGAILGVAGATTTYLFLQERHVVLAAKKSDVWMLLLFLGYNLILGFGQSGVSNASHLGGLFVGTLMGGGLYLPLRWAEKRSALRQYTVFAGMSLLLIIGAFLAKAHVVK